MKIKLGSHQLRGLVRDAMPMTFGKYEDEPFTESSRDDGCLHYMVDCDKNGECFEVQVPLRGFLAARFGVGVESVVLHWSDYEWRYSAEVDGVILTEADRQLLDQYDA